MKNMQSPCENDEKWRHSATAPPFSADPYGVGRQRRSSCASTALRPLSESSLTRARRFAPMASVTIFEFAGALELLFSS